MVYVKKHPSIPSFIEECVFFVNESNIADLRNGIPETYFIKRSRPSIRRIHSHCIRGTKDSPEISSELCAKAKKLAKEMNYRPNPFAMSLREEYPRVSLGCCTGYRYPFLRIHPERDREYGSGQRILYHHHHFTRILRI